MASSELPNIPDSLKAIRAYITTAKEHDDRDPTISYWLKYYAANRALAIDKTSPDAKRFIMALMDNLEAMKTATPIETITSEIVGQAHFENYSLKLFVAADTQDREGRFSPQLVRLFYTTSLLFDVLCASPDVFTSPASEDIERSRRYAKWKSTYIHQCLKTGKTPIPGPADSGEEEFSVFGVEANNASQPVVPPYNQPPKSPSHGLPMLHPAVSAAQHPASSQRSSISGANGVAATTNAPLPHPAMSSAPPAQPGNLSTEDYFKAMRWCKFATNALQYEDPGTAIKYLQKTLTFLTTGQEIDDK